MQNEYQFTKKELIALIETLREDEDIDLAELGEQYAAEREGHDDR